jgi:hypothetical protein
MALELDGVVYCHGSPRLDAEILTTASPAAAFAEALAAVEELLAAGLPGYEDQLQHSLLDPADPDWVAGFFERSAGRG